MATVGGGTVEVRPWLISDFVSPRFVLFTVLVALNLLDVTVTMLGIDRQVLAESNPLMRLVIDEFHTAAGVKLAALGFVAVALRSIRPRWTLMELVLSIGVGWYLAVVIWNISLVVG